MKIYAIPLAIGLSVAGLALAAAPGERNACKEVQVCGCADCCGHCGHKCPCRKYCRVVCEMKEVKKHVWVVECEEFCPLLPGRRDCSCGQCGDNEACDSQCGCGGGKCDPCAAEEGKCRIPPKCGKMRVKKKLAKKEVVCKVPSYKCVVVYCCPKCECIESGEAPPPPPPPPAGKDAPLPPAPSPDKTTFDAPLLPPAMSAI